MTLVDEIEKKKIKHFQNAVKLKWIQLSDLSMQSKMNLLISLLPRKTSNNCQKMFEENEEIIRKLTLEKIKKYSWTRIF